MVGQDGDGDHKNGGEDGAEKNAENAEHLQAAQCGDKGQEGMQVGGAAQKPGPDGVIEGKENGGQKQHDHAHGPAPPCNSRLTATPTVTGREPTIGRNEAMKTRMPINAASGTPNTMQAMISRTACTPPETRAARITARQMAAVVRMSCSVWRDVNTEFRLK